MTQLKYQGRELSSRPEENVLDALLRHGISIPFSCRNGICHVCLQQCVQGEVPAAAQRGLRPELREHGYFMPCKCIPQTDMEIVPPTGLYATTLVHSKQMLAENVCRLLIEPAASFVYRAGQFINLRRSDGVVRSYSLASLPVQDYFLEIHVQRKTGGIMSNWILDELQAGDEIDIQGAGGECYYQDEEHTHPLLLVGSGTGLSPLVGILRDALHQQHRGEIHLYHGARDQEGCYLREELRRLEQHHAGFHYHECLSNEADVQGGRVHEVAFAQQRDLHGWQVYLAGPADMVECGEQLALRQGAEPAAIHTDAFALRELRQTPRNADQPGTAPADPAARPATDEAGKYPPADPELWSALREGEMLLEVLQDFYGRVFQDARLASFFDGVTRQRSIEKQYLFLRQILTGEKIYFGDRPRNAHHWMVISDELFDYRANLMLSCLREHGLPEAMVQRFHDVEEFYRRDIVKSAPVARLMGDVELPLDGFDELIIDVGSLCDSCAREVSPGEKVIYHVRLGKIYCSDCSAGDSRKN